MKDETPCPKCDAVENLAGRSQMTRLADFLFEAGMLRKTPRSGYQFLGSGAENVAEHSFRTAFIGMVLARMAGIAPERVVMLCLVHDFHEARTGDFNYVNQLYNTSNGKLAMQHATGGTGLEDLLVPLWEEQEDGETQEALLAKDADQLDLIANLVEENALGNKYAAKWLEAAVQRLRTEQGKQLAGAITSTDHTDWWFKGPDPAWWARKTPEK